MNTRTTKLEDASLWLYVSIMSYLTCMAFHGLCVHGSSCSRGVEILAFGWLGVFYGHSTNLTWLANPLLFNAWALILLRKRRAAIIGSIAAFVGGFLFLVFSNMDGVEVDEGGGDYPVTGYGVGYWLWLVSMICAFIASLRLNSGVVWNADNDD